MLKLGVTGGIGSGKSVVCKIFECLGIPVFRADEEGRRLLNEDAEVQKQVVALLGNSVIINGKPDRKKIAHIVFHDATKLAQLNAIIHPAVRKSFTDWAKQQKSELLVEEAAILFESGSYKNLDKILVVTAPEEQRIKRVMERDKVTEAEVKKRMQNQWRDEEKTQKADFVIVNDEKGMLTPQVIDIVNKLTTS